MINGVPYTKLHIPKDTRKRRPGTIRKPRTLTIHSTGNPNSIARGERGWLTNPSNTEPYTGWHVCVDEREAIEAIPPNEKAYHAGDGTGAGNSYSIGLEICESGNRAKTLLNAAKVVAALLQEYDLTISDLRQHYDWNRKNCPSILRTGTRWQEFVSSVQAWLNYEKPKAPEPIPEPEVPHAQPIPEPTPQPIPQEKPPIPEPQSSVADWSDVGTSWKKR